MRVKSLWLIPAFLFLISVIGSANAHAHSVGPVTAQSVAEEDQDSSLPAVQACSPGGESGAPCDCPGGHCACTVDCLAMCAATAVAADLIAIDFLAARLPVAPKKDDFSAGWIPYGDIDPPRPIA